jgi:hypothetical protein
VNRAADLCEAIVCIGFPHPIGRHIGKIFHGGLALFKRAFGLNLGGDVAAGATITQKGTILIETRNAIDTQPTIFGVGSLDL